MPNLFAKARSWLPGAMQATAGVEATYTRDAVSLDITPWIGQTVFASNAEGGPRVEYGERDYLIPVGEIASLGVPRVGDRIREVIDGVAMVFEVQQPNTGEKAWRYSDPARSVYRVHCKRVS